LHFVTYNLYNLKFWYAFKICSTYDPWKHVEQNFTVYNTTFKCADDISKIFNFWYTFVCFDVRSKLTSHISSRCNILFTASHYEKLLILHAKKNNNNNTSFNLITSQLFRVISCALFYYSCSFSIHQNIILI
jgi:hypothetical protein